MPDIFDEIDYKNADVFDEIDVSQKIEKPFSERAKEISKHEASADFRTAPRMAMQGTIGGLELLSLLPELAIGGTTRLADVLGAGGLTEKYEGGRGFGKTLATAPFRLFGLQTEPETTGEQLSREVPGAFALAKGIGEAAPKIGQKLLPLAEKLFAKKGIGAATESVEGFIGKPTAKTLQKPSQEVSKAISSPYQAKPLEPERFSKGGISLKIQVPSENLPKVPVSNIETAQHQARQRIGKMISPVKFENDASGGMSLRKTIQEKAKEERKLVSSDYEVAERQYQGHESPFTQDDPETKNTLRQRLIDKKNKLTDDDRLTSDELNASERVVVNQINQLLNILGPEGKSVPISTVIRKSKSISSSLPYEEIYGGAKDILKSVVHDLNNSVGMELKSLGVDVDLISKADKSFANWSNLYSNDEISPFMKRGVERSPEFLFDKFTTDPGTYRAVSEALGTKNEKLVAQATRNLIEKKMAPYLKDLKKVGTPEYTDEIANLETLIGKENASVLDKEVRNLKRTLYPKELEKGKPSLPSPLEKIISKKTALSETEIKSKIKTPEGRKEVKSLLEEIPNGEKLYDELIATKIHSELKKGRVKVKPTFKDAFEVFNKEENFDLISEKIGDEKATKLLDFFEKGSNREISKERIFKFATSILHKSELAWLLKLLIL